MRKYKFLFPALLMTTFISSNVIHAEEPSIDPDLIEEVDSIGVNEDTSELVEGIDYDIEEATVYSEESSDLENSNFESSAPLQSSSNNDRITPSMVLMPGPEYKFSGVKYIKETIGKSILWKTSGVPGVTIGLDFTKSRNASVSTTYGASYHDISQSLSFTIGKSYSVSSSGSYKVPKSRGGKAIKRTEVTGQPIYKKYSVKVSKRNDILFRYDYKGLLYAYKPIGVHIKYKHYYK